MEHPTNEIERQLSVVIREFLAESKTARGRQALTLDISLERDLGLGSLEKAELLHRIETAFNVRLSESLLSEANTLRDLVTAIQHAHPTEWISSSDTVARAPEAQTDVSGTKTLVDVLLKYAETEPERPHIYLQDDQGAEQIIRYGQLFHAASSVAGALSERGLKGGETVALMLPTSADFFYGFFGILLAGGIPVPIYPPARLDQIEEYARREAVILRNAEVRFLITFHQGQTLSKLLSAFVPSLQEVTTVSLLMAAQQTVSRSLIEASSPALIQYTSGSTSDPKGVLLNHQNLLANIRAIAKVVQVTPQDVGVSWLPLYHDMGLIGSWLVSFYHGIPIVIFSPLIFLRRPERWLWTIHRHGGTLSAAPNFAYEFCLRKIADKDIEGLNLRSWRLALNGAEAIYPDTFNRFAERFAAYGFKSEACYPVYGLAESSVALTMPPPGRALQIDKIARDPFEKKGRAEPSTSDERSYLEFVSCGTAIPGHAVRIVDEQGDVVADRIVGNLQFKGPSAMVGYYRNPAATEAVCHEGWLDSGDLAYQVSGETYIVGRKKDVIIKTGRNLHPQEIEAIAAQVSGVRKGCVVAFGVSDASSGTEKFIIVAETNEKQSEARDNIVADIIDKVVAALSIPPDEVVLVQPYAIPKTSSGKLRRAACKELYRQGKLSGFSLPAWLQIAKLYCKGAGRIVSRSLGKMGQLLYTLYGIIMVAVSLPVGWSVALLLPRQRAAAFCRGWARLLFLLAACPLSVSGQDNITKSKAMVVVANHASYLDGLVLLAVLPTDIAFVGKRELLKVPIIRSLFKKLGYFSINRLEFTESVTDAKHIAELIQQGRTVVIFPEGTFSYPAGLRSFKLGAFKVAVETACPVCPIGLQGTRRVLGLDARIAMPGRIHVTIGKPLVPESQEWQEVLRLCELAQAEIAKAVDEQVLG